MADDRQFQIRDRAGLEESKLNVEFIEFLRKWGTPMLMAVAVVVGVYALYTRWERAQQAEVSAAFEELTSASSGGRPNPTSLLELADKYAKIKSVGLMARMSAADAWLQAVRQRVAIGAAIKNEDGTLLDEKTGTLTPELREQYLNSAKQQYQAVLDTTKGVAEKRLMAVAAAFGLAAVAESSGNFSEARTAYETAKALSEQAGDTLHVEVATKRLDSIDSIKEAPLLLLASDASAYITGAVLAVDGGHAVSAL